MMIAPPSFRMLGLLVLLVTAYVPKATIAPVNPQSLEKLSETLRSADSAPGPCGLPSTRITSLSSSEQDVAQRDKVPSQIERDSTKAAPPSQLLVAGTQEQSKGKGKNPVTPTRDETKAHARNPVFKPQRERTTLQKQFDNNRGTLTEMENQYKSLKNDMERLRDYFGRYDEEARSSVEKLIAYPKKHFPRLFTMRLGELGGIGRFISELESKPMTVSMAETGNPKLMTVSMPEAANPRSNQVENSAQVPELHEATEVRTLSGDELQLVKEAANIAMVQDLRDLFRRIVPEHAVDAHLKQLHLGKQTYYDRMIFQVLNFMFKFQLISPHEMRSFFDRPETLELTWLHLSRVFQKDLNGIRGYHAFIPQMNFIAREWKVDHLGGCLAGLNKKQKSYLVYKALQWTIEDLDDIAKRPLNRTPESASITEFFCKEEVFRNFWSLEPSSSDFGQHQSELIGEYIKKSIDLFQNFPKTSPRYPVTPETKQIEFLVNFHILHFFKTYGSRQVQLIMQNTPSPLFTEEFELIASGFGRYQLLKWTNDYHYFLEYPNHFQKTIPSSVSEANKMKLEKERKQMENKSSNHSNKMCEFQFVHKVSDKWSKQVPVHEILETLATFASHSDHLSKQENKNMWLFDTAPHVTTKMLETNNLNSYIQKLTSHLTCFFDLNFWDVTKLLEYIRKDRILLEKAIRAKLH